jgi:hypothetical protein
MHLLAASLALMAATMQFPCIWGLRVIVSDDLAPTSTNYPVYFFTQGAIASGEQMGMQTEVDRDILRQSPMLCQLTCTIVYHPVGAKWTVGTTNPTQAQLATIGNWTKVYENKNLGIVRATVTSNF